MRDLEEYLRSRLVEIRKIRRYSRKNLAERLGCTVSKIGNIESGRSSMSVRFLNELSKEVGISIFDLFASDEGVHLYPLSVKEFHKNIEHSENICFFSNNIVPLPYQTEGYMRVILYDFYPLVDKKTSFDDFNLKLNLQKELSRRNVNCIIHPSALYQMVGDARTMLEQVRYLEQIQDKFFLINTNKKCNTLSFYNFIIFDNRTAVSEIFCGFIQTSNNKNIALVRQNWDFLLDACVDAKTKERFLQGSVRHWTNLSQAESPFL